MALKVIIVDDSAIFRSGIKQILVEEFGLVEVTHGGPVSAGLDWASGPWDLVFVTLDPAALDKIQFIAEPERTHPKQRVIALASRENIPHLEEVLKGYAWRLIAVDGTRGEFVSAVRDALAGAERTGLKNPAPMSLLVSGPGTPLNRGLSKREREVLETVVAGMSLKEAAATLNISVSTVSTYRVRLRRKLGLRSTAELIRCALGNGLERLVVTK